MYDFYKGLVDIISYILLLGHNKGKLCRYFHHKLLVKLYVDLCFDTTVSYGRLYKGSWMKFKVEGWEKFSWYSLDLKSSNCSNNYTLIT